MDQETLGALPKDLFSDPLVMKAIKVAEAISTNNYFDFFKIMREVPYVMKCLMHALSFEIRKNSIKALTRYKEAKLVELEKKLFFTSINEVNEFAQIFMHTDGNSIPKGANFRDVKDVTLYKIPQIIKDIEPGQELQDMVYNGEKCEKCEQLQTFEQNTVQGPLSLFSPLLQKVQVKPAETTKSKAKEKEEEKAEGEEEEEEEEEKDKAEEKCLAYEKRLEDMKTIEKQRRAKEEEDRKRLEREKELEEIRIKEADKRRKDELRAKKLKEEEEEEDRKRKLKREAEKQEQERKAEERTTKAINKVQGLDFQGIMNKAKCERHCKWKVVAIFQGKAASKQNYAQRFLDRKISFTEDGKNKDIEFVKVYGLENVRENDVYGSQTVILCGDIWDNERLAKVLDKAMYAKGEVIVIYEKSFETHPKLNRKVSLFQVTQTPPPHIKDLEITKELEKIVSASYKRSYEPLKNIGLEKTTLYSYVKAKFEEVSTVKMSTKHLQYWNSPEFFYERTNTVVSMIMKDIVGSRVKSLNMLGYSEPKFMANVRRVLLNLRVPELRWSQLIEQRPLRLDKDFIEKATELFSSFIKQFKIAGTEGAVENFRRILCFVVLNNGQQRSPAQALVNGIHWSGIYSDLMARAIEETIKANDFEVIVDTTINAEKYKTLDKQFENRIKEFLSACAEENVDRNSSEDAEKLQPPAQKKRKYKYETNGIRAEITPLKSVESIVCAEKERWEAEFEAILSGN